jgi:hypothetical protein
MTAVVQIGAPVRIGVEQAGRTLRDTSQPDRGGRRLCAKLLIMCQYAAVLCIASVLLLHWEFGRSASTAPATPMAALPTDRLAATLWKEHTATYQRGDAQRHGLHHHDKERLASTFHEFNLYKYANQSHGTQGDQAVDVQAVDTYERPQQEGSTAVAGKLRPSSSPSSAYSSGVGTLYAYEPASDTVRSIDGRVVDVLTASRVWAWREEVREAIQHSFGAYMEHAYPWDELKPLTCTGRRWDARERGTLDDPLGGFSLTLIDSLDTLVMTGDLPAFRCGVATVIQQVSFDRDVTVSVFETSIRVLGGLLSAHLFASDPKYGIYSNVPRNTGNAQHTSALYCGARCPVFCMYSYENQLLDMAIEIADRLLPAFDTPLGIPYHRINLQTGVQDPTSRETCSAAAGTFLLEWGVLSRITGDPVYGAVARRAMAAIWARRGPITGLIGAGIDALDGNWRGPHAGVGAGIDSFYEYMLKSAIAFDDETLAFAYDALATAVEDHLNHAGTHIEVSIVDGRPSGKNPSISSLQTFYPGLEVTAGQVSRARQHYIPLLSLWNVRKALPEAYDMAIGGPVSFARDSPLRPELLESTYHLYTATRDPVYLWAAAGQFHAINNQSRVACGFASIADVETCRLNCRLDDRMDSYFLAETLKYTFLTFDTALKHWYDAPSTSHWAEVSGRRGEERREEEGEVMGEENKGGYDDVEVGITPDGTATIFNMHGGHTKPHAHDLWTVVASGLRFSVFDGLNTGVIDLEQSLDMRGIATERVVASLPDINEEGIVFTTEGHPIDLLHPQLLSSTLFPWHARRQRILPQCPRLLITPSVHSKHVPAHEWTHASALPLNLQAIIPSSVGRTFGLLEQNDAFKQYYESNKRSISRPPIVCTTQDIAHATLFTAPRTTQQPGHSPRSVTNQSTSTSSTSAACTRATRNTDAYGCVGSLDLQASELPPFESTIMPAVKDAVHMHLNGLVGTPAPVPLAGIPTTVLPTFLAPLPAALTQQVPMEASAWLRILMQPQHKEHMAKVLEALAQAVETHPNHPFAAVLHASVAQAHGAIRSIVEIVDSLNKQPSGTTNAQADGVLALLHPFLANKLSSFSAREQAAFNALPEIPHPLASLPVLTSLLATKSSVHVPAQDGITSQLVAQTSIQSHNRSVCAQLWLRDSADVLQEREETVFTSPGWTRWTIFPPSRLETVLNHGEAEPDESPLGRYVSTAAHNAFAIKNLFDAFALHCDPLTVHSAATTNMAMRLHPATIAFNITRQGVQEPWEHEYVFNASTAAFGPLLTHTGLPFTSFAIAHPFDACGAATKLITTPITGGNERPLVIAARGTCSFATKVRRVTAAGGVALLILDVQPPADLPPGHHPGGDAAAYVDLPPSIQAAYRRWGPSEFDMAGDNEGNVFIPSLFLAGQSAAAFVQAVGLTHASCVSATPDSDRTTDLTPGTCTIAHLAALAITSDGPAFVRPVDGGIHQLRGRVYSSGGHLSSIPAVLSLEIDSSRRTCSDVRGGRWLQQLAGSKNAHIWDPSITRMASCMRCLVTHECVDPVCTAAVQACTHEEEGVCQVESIQLNYAAIANPSVFEDVLREVFKGQD